MRITFRVFPPARFLCCQVCYHFTITLTDELHPAIEDSLDKDPKERPSFNRLVDLLEDYYFLKYPKTTEQTSQSNAQDSLMIEELRQQLAKKEREIGERDTRIVELMGQVKNLEEQLQGTLMSRFLSSYLTTDETQ